MKNALSKLTLFLCGIFLGLTTAEIGARLLYTKPWYERLIEEQIQNDPTADVRHNALDLRDRDYSSVKSPHVKRVLILGDSFTYGSGVTDDSAVFPRVLAKRLNAELAASGRAVEILNGGLPGSLTGDWVDLLSKVKDSFHPDVILIVFFLRDGTRTNSMGSFFEPIRNEIVLQNHGSKLYQSLYLYKLYKDRKDRLSIAQRYTKAIRESYLGTPEQTQEWQTAQSNIRRISAAGREIHAALGLVVFPILADLDDTYPFKDVCDRIATFGIANGIPTHSLLPAFLGQNASDLWVSSANQHPNARGHRLAADSILPFLRRLLAE